MTARDRNALAKLVARYGLAIVAQEADGLHSARRRPGRPTDRHWLPRAFIRWGLVQGKLLNDPKLNPSAAAEAINGRDSSSTLRKAYVKFERLRQLHPELKERSDKMLRFALRMEALEERLKPLGLYREEVINALWDENVTEEEWLALCHRFAPK
jgi:hypothetical protein